MATAQEIQAQLDIPALIQELIPASKLVGKEIMGLCPFHDDHHPSLSINPVSGKYFCHACNTKGSIFDLYGKIHGLDFKGSIQDLARKSGQSNSKAKQVVTGRYEYHSSDGTSLYWKVRVEPGRDGRSKEFYFQSEGNKFKRGCPPVLYALDKVVTAKTVIFNEGEKQADLLNSWNIADTAGTSLDSGSSSKFPTEMINVLVNKDVIVLRDNDQPGLVYAQTIANALQGKCRSLKIILLPGLPDKGDICNWVQIAGNDKDRLLDLIAQAPEWEAEASQFEPTQENEASEPDEIEQLISQFNKTRFVSTEGGKTAVYTETWDETMMRSVLIRSSFIDFMNFYLNQYVCVGTTKSGDPIFKSLGGVWLKHPNRRTYEGITLTPGREIPNFYNLWRGFSVKSIPGSWKLMRAHIFYIICTKNDANYQYVIGWLATAVQKPGQQAEVALVLRGKRGTGKGMLGNYVCKLFGSNGAHIFSSKYLTGNFNSHLRDVVFLYADEAFWAGDKQGESVLKGLITEPTLTIEGKGKDVVFVRNMLHVLMTSNNDWIVPAGLEERRFCVLDVCDSKMQDKAYFAALVAEMDNGGMGAMLHDLLAYDLSNFDIRKVPQTSGLFEQKLQSFDDFHQWWFHRLSEGELVPGHVWVEFIPCATLYKAFIEGLANRAVRHRSGETHFGLSLKKVLPKGWPQKKNRVIKVLEGGYTGNTSRQVNHYRFPELEICRDHFDSLINYEVNWNVEAE